MTLYLIFGSFINNLFNLHDHFRSTQIEKIDSFKWSLHSTLVERKFVRRCFVLYLYSLH